MAYETTRVTWSAGEIIIGGGRRYKVIAGNSYVALGDQNLPNANSAATQKVIIFFDVDQAPNVAADGAITYDISCAPADTAMGGTAVFTEGRSKIELGWAQYGSPNAQYSISAMYKPSAVNTSNQTPQTPVETTIANDSITAAHLKASARPWTSSIEFRGTAWNAIIWDNGSAGTDATVAFADGSTNVVVADGNETGLASGTWYMFIDGLVNNTTESLQKSQTFTDAIGDTKILLAIVTVAANANSGDKPVILPFNGKRPTINAVAIAGDSITADAIAAGSIVAGDITSGTFTGLQFSTSVVNDSGTGTGDGYLKIGDASGTNPDQIILKSGDDYSGRIQFRGRFNYEEGEIIPFDNPANSSPQGFFYIRTKQGDMVIGAEAGYGMVPTPTSGNSSTGLYLGRTGSRWREAHVHNTIFYGALSAYSDERIKTNIADITNSDSLTFINSLNPRKFTKTDGSAPADEVKYGLIAQEVETALEGLSIDKTKLGLIQLPATETTSSISPDTATRGQTVITTNYRSLDYTQLIAPLIGAVKELKRRLEIVEGG